VNDSKDPIGWAKEKAQAAKARMDTLLEQRSKVTIGMAAAVGGGVAALFVLTVWLWLFIGLPQVPGAEALWAMNRQPGVTFVSAKGQVLGVRGAYYGQGVRLGELPRYVPEAFLAIEDQRFYEHGGVDRQAVLRAAISNLLSLHTRQGGSTITQQLCKNLFLTPEQTIRRKLQEMILAKRVEDKLSKDEILELYLNRIYMGERAYGIDAASRIYFGKPATALTVAEAAMLAGLPKAPSAYAPTRAFAKATERQRTVLQTMVDSGALTKAAAQEAAGEKIKIAKATSRESDMGYVFDIATDQARQLVANAPPDLVVHVTVDPDIQSAASRAVATLLPKPGKDKKQMQAAIVTLDNDGGVKAMVGGVSHTDSKFNRATQALRQPGSSFKTFVYAAAFEAGVADPDSVYYDEPFMIGGWQPKNYYGDFRGAVNLRTALALSINTVAVRVGQDVGEQKVAALARRFGIKSKLDPVPSLALGSSAVTPFEMTQAYSTFMREGRYMPAYIVQSVENARGDVLYQRPPVEPTQVYDTGLAHQMTGMLGRVVVAGTGTGARLADRDTAGKTGTSSDWRDAWFIGFTADYTTGVWVGFDDNSEMAHVSGATIPSSIFRTVMTAASRGVPPRPLPGYNLPPRPESDFQRATFYDALSAAFGFGDKNSDEPPDITQ
jgi:penicillin-binding protein 1A